jgi:hypothetical protein
MFKDKKKKSGLDLYADQIKEVSIRKNFPKQKPQVQEYKNFLYCDPPEVILQSK